ncbi:MAG TPA: hypothetical protein VL967_15495 [Terracidiphilus sp.]|nr:hypothetical protein [Terracidiphilus sp.]
MIQLIAKTRFRVAILLLLCGFVFIASLALVIFSFTAGFGPAPASSRVNWVAIFGITLGVVSMLGTASTLVLAWRADVQVSGESTRKIARLQQQIVELQSKLNTPSEQSR